MGADDGLSTTALNTLLIYNVIWVTDAELMIAVSGTCIKQPVAVCASDIPENTINTWPNCTCQLCMIDDALIYLSQSSYLIELKLQELII